MDLIIDAHQHFWDRSKPRFDYSWQELPQMKPICKSFLPADLEPLLQESGVAKSVFVQTQHDLEENRWVLELVSQTDFVAGVVGWVDLQSEACGQQLDEFICHPKFVGIRHVVQDEPNDDFIVDPRVIRGLAALQERDVPYDLLFFRRHLKHAPTVADRLPNLRMVIDHLSKPEIKNGEFDHWRAEILEAAKRPNLWCKLSGLVTEADWDSWTPEQLKPYVETAIDAFGPERLMFGSDWPVCLLAASYLEVLQSLMFCISDLSQNERSMILGRTAADFYSLKV